MTDEIRVKILTAIKVNEIIPLRELAKRVGHLNRLGFLSSIFTGVLWGMEREKEIFVDRDDKEGTKIMRLKSNLPRP